MNWEEIVFDNTWCNFFLKNIRKKHDMSMPIDLKCDFSGEKKITRNCIAVVHTTLSYTLSFLMDREKIYRFHRHWLYIRDRNLDTLRLSELQKKLSLWKNAKAASLLSEI